MLSLLEEAREALQHQVLYGTNNEGLLMDFLRQRLPTSWSVAGGEVLRADGERSPQCDIIVYDRVHYPPAFVSPSGSVVVVAHSVGAVVEVKSSLASGQVSDPRYEGDAQALATQMNRVHEFFSSMHSAAALEAEKNDRSLPEDLKNRCSRTGPLVYGFAYTSSIQEDTIEAALSAHLNGEFAARVFVLDVPRPHTEISHRLGETIAQGASAADIREFTDWHRMPNGFSFHRDQLGLEWVMQHYPATAGCLNNLARELMDEIRHRTMLGIALSENEHEQLYSAYHSWAGLYSSDA